jgi:hypothetical protein
MRTFVLVAIALLAVSGAFAQGPGRGDMREPPATSAARDGAAPADGAIGSGSGRERDPAAEASPVPGTAAPTETRTERAASRCNELAGPLREQCLLQEHGAGTGGTAVPQPRTAPPPHNPR